MTTDEPTSTRVMAPATRTTQELVEQREVQPPTEVASRGTAPSRRFGIVASVTVVISAVVYLWVSWDLWTGIVNPLRTEPSIHSAYDLQARAMLHGQFSIPNGSLSAEGFLHNGKTYTYFGIFPSIIRMPVLLVTHSLDGRLTAISMFAAWLTTALFVTLLIWRVRILIRGSALLGWTEATSYGVLLASVLTGSVLLYLGSQPNTYSEDISWSVALACASLFALAGVVERPSWWRVTAAGVLVLLTNLNRSTTGYACIAASILLAGWFALGRDGPHRRRWAWPLAVSGIASLALGCAIDLAKFDILFGFPARAQLLFQAFGFAHVNGGHYWGLRYLPSTLQAYLAPAGVKLMSLFPYITLPDSPAHEIAHTPLFTRAPTASVPASMPFLFTLSIWGFVVAFTRQHRPAFRALRLLLVAVLVPAGAVMVFGWILERFVGDFMPFLTLASAIGLIDIWSRLVRSARLARLVVDSLLGVLALFGLVANVGFAVVPTSRWTQVQADHYVSVTRALSDVTGHPLAHDVVRGTSFPVGSPMGQLFIEGDCRALYLADQAVPKTFYSVPRVWKLVERAPHTPICDSLLADASSASGTKTTRTKTIRTETVIITPGPGSVLSGADVHLAALVTTRVATLTFVLSDATHTAASLPGDQMSAGLWTANWDSRSVPDGTYTLRSTVTDAAGYRAVSNGVKVTVHNPASGP